MYFRSNLSYLRKKKKLKQEDVAKIIGLCQRTIGYYENGDREPTFENLLNLAHFFGVSVDDLLKKDLSKEEVRKMQREGKSLQEMANEIGNLVIKNGFSYNQTKKLFELILERLKDVPYQSEGSSKE